MQPHTMSFDGPCFVFNLWTSPPPSTPPSGNSAPTPRWSVVPLLLPSGLQNSKLPYRFPGYTLSHILSGSPGRKLQRKLKATTSSSENSLPLYTAAIRTYRLLNISDPPIRATSTFTKESKGFLITFDLICHDNPPIPIICCRQRAVPSLVFRMW